MANSRDFTGKNRKFTGTKGIVVAKGTTGQRVGSESGELRFNTTTELMEYYDGNQWKPIDAPPTISSVSTSDSVGTNLVLNADGSTLFTITIAGGNFSLSPTVRFIGSTGTEYIPGNINRVSNSSITCTTLITMGTTDDPYDVRVTNTSGLSATLDDAFSFNARPVFVNASGQIGTVFDGKVVSGSTLNCSATDAESNTITYSIISGSLPGSGLTLSSSTGFITGTLSGTPSLGNYPFVVRAATTEGTVERQFSIQVISLPTGGTITTYSSGGSDYRVHTFTTSGTFTPPNTISVDMLLVAGGGSGGTDNGSGAGAGGKLEPTGISALAQAYTITIGGGGASVFVSAVPGNQGVNSTALGYTALGGGYGGGWASSSGNSGGSGAGQSADSSSGYTGPFAGTAGQGNAGGGAVGNYSGGGGGKGGAGVAGVNGTAGRGGAVGNNAFRTGSNVGYAGGGTGGWNASCGYTSSGHGEVNGVAKNTGGGGGTGTAPESDCPVNTGHGGHGANHNDNRSGGGGSGICVIRYTI